LAQSQTTRTSPLQKSSWRGSSPAGRLRAVARKSPPAAAHGVAIQSHHPGDSLGLRYGNLLEAVKLIEAGLPMSALLHFQRASGLTLERLKQSVRISEGSFARRKKSGRLSPDESERLLRIARIFERATALYDGDQDGAREWLETAIPSLGNQRPLDLAQTEPGAREVEDLIGRIEYGVVS
jgi:putative toxin-antitoxin system antitoxin component (TIGR02293 family)